MTVACGHKSLFLCIFLSLSLSAACSPAAPTDATLESRVSPDGSTLLGAEEPRALDDPLPIQPTQGSDFTSRQLGSAQKAALGDKPAGGSGAEGATVALGEASRFGGVSTADIAEWRRTLDRIARVSKRGESAVVLRRMVLDALEAPSAAEYRQTLRDLRTRMAAAGRDVSGGDTPTLTRGGDVTGIDFPLGWMQSAGQPGTAESSEAFSEGDELEGSASRSHLDNVDELAVHECSTTWEGIVYEDECATQEEIDDALAILEALHSETTADYAEAETECINKYGNECPAFLDEEQSLEALAVTSTAWPASHTSQVPSWDTAGMADREDADGYACEAADGPLDGAQAAGLGCVSEAATALEKSANFFLSWAGGESILRFTPVTRSGALAIKGTLIGLAFSTGWAIGTWIDCMI